MVMVANKKTSQQMSDDLALFLGNNTITFTVWLHGVLEKLRSVAVEPESLMPRLYSDTGISAVKSEGKVGMSKGLVVSSSLSDRTEAHVSSSAHEYRRVSSDKTSSSSHTSAVKPQLDSSEAVIDIKPELDDELIGEDPVDMGVLPSRLRGSDSGGRGGRAATQIYQPPQGRSSSGTGRSADAYRSSEGSSGYHSRQQHGSYHLESRSSRGCRAYRDGGSSRIPEWETRKRKAPVVSSVVRVNQAADEGPDSDELEEEDDEEDEGYGVKSMSSRVSLPSKPERKPSLPPAKQANKNLLMRAISEAQVSINKTTAYPAVPQRQTVPVAPRTRSASDEMKAAIQLVQEHLRGLAPRGQTYPSSESQAPRQLALEVAEGSGLKPFDIRSYIMRRSELGEEVPVRSRLGPLGDEVVPVRSRLGPLGDEVVPVRSRLGPLALGDEVVPVRSRLGPLALGEEVVPVRSRLGPLGDEVVPVRSRLGPLALGEEVPMRSRREETTVPVRSRLGLEEVAPHMRSRREETTVPMRSRLGLEEVAPPMRSRREETTVPMRSRLGAMVMEEIQPATPRMVQPASREKSETAGSASPKFIVTLDGVPSPLGSLGYCDMEADNSCPKPAKTSMPDPSIHLGTNPKFSIRHRLQGETQYSDGEEVETEEEAGPVKRPKVLERCKFWPVCKSGDSCVYHHPTTQCKIFPSCKFGDKCLFVHPNCKFDAKCSKPDCPFTHVSRGGPASYTPPARPVPPPQSRSVCSFFPECKKMSCLFYHPKPCRFGAQCKRTGCTFYHPTASVPPRHALKWTKAQSS
uniref:Zinc finger CCCH domain-containing protein 14 n=1 Tax=Hucho hucho TaxID=62062 RepID=A0A4W5RPK7_9TELE